jgi:hypothetical protein
MCYKAQKASYRINGERIEFSAYEPKTGVLIVSQAPKDDDKFIYIGQQKESNYLNANSPNMSELGSQGTDLLLLHIVIEKLNTILKEKLYGMDAAGIEQLHHAIERQKGACLHDFLTCGQYSKSEFELFSKKFVVTFNQRRHMALNAALKYIKSIRRELESSKLIIGIPRSFPAYIQISREPTDLELHTVNDQLITELKMHPEFAENPLVFDRKKAYLPTMMLFGGKMAKRGKKNSIQPINV